MSDQRISNLALIAKKLHNKYSDELESKKEKGKALLQMPDFLWYELLMSYSTWGGERGYKGMIENKMSYQQVTYEELKKLGGNEDRVNRLRQIMKAANVRYYNKKAPLLSRCFEKIEDMKGVVEATKTLLDKKSADEMIKFLDDLPGIGPKYSRDIMMDSYHPFFHDKIALDSRVKSVSKALGLTFTNNQYEEHEDFYLKVAQEAGIEGWELDRLMFCHREDFLSALKIAD